MNKSILQNGENLLEKNVNTSREKIVISLDVKNYIEFCLTLGLKQLIKVPTRITSNTSTLIDHHILTSSSEKVVQTGITGTFLSDHQFIFCTRNIKRAKPNKHNYTFRSMKNFSSKIYEEALGKLTFPDYKNFRCFNEAYSNLTSKLF